MGDFDLASLIFLLQSLQPIFGGIGSFFGALFQFLFLGFDLGTFFLGFV